MNDRRDKAFIVLGQRVAHAGEQLAFLNTGQSNAIRHASATYWTQTIDYLEVLLSVLNRHYGERAMINLKTMQPELVCHTCGHPAPCADETDTINTVLRSEPCRKRGPYLPVGDVEWECLTHGVVLVPVSPPNEHGDYRKDQLACPVGEPGRVEAS